MGQIVQFNQPLNEKRERTLKWIDKQGGKPEKNKSLASLIPAKKSISFVGPLNHHEKTYTDVTSCMRTNRYNRFPKTSPMTYGSSKADLNDVSAAPNPTGP